MPAVGRAAMPAVDRAAMPVRRGDAMPVVARTAMPVVRRAKAAAAAAERAAETPLNPERGRQTAAVTAPAWPAHSTSAVADGAPLPVAMPVVVEARVLPDPVVEDRHSRLSPLAAEDRQECLSSIEPVVSESAASPGRKRFYAGPRTQDAGLPEPPVVRVTIGRVEVRAAAPPPAPRPAAAPPAGPRISLDDYLRGKTR
jgi:hypothetical protein